MRAPLRAKWMVIVEVSDADLLTYRDAGRGKCLGRRHLASGPSRMKADDQRHGAADARVGTSTHLGVLNHHRLPLYVHHPVSARAAKPSCVRSAGFALIATDRCGDHMTMCDMASIAGVLAQPQQNRFPIGE